jgi:hypothetical protein
MVRNCCLTIVLLVLASPDACAQMMYADPGGWSGGSAAGVQLYPFDQQDTWIHGHFQRYPSYGGYASFRPYNYKHVAAQSQIAAGWGAPLGMPYSQQFWNRYRGNYLEGQAHIRSQNAPLTIPRSNDAAAARPVQPITWKSYPTAGPARPANPGRLQPAPASQRNRR